MLNQFFIKKYNHKNNQEVAIEENDNYASRE